jgi:hypothetical protein
MNIQERLERALSKLENYSLDEIKVIIEEFGYDLNDAGHSVSSAYHDSQIKEVTSFTIFTVQNYSFFSCNDNLSLEIAA